jgi:hypothetical protein
LSVLSGVNLSNISNIAIQSLPIYADDLKANHLYSFDEGDAPVRRNLLGYPWHEYLVTPRANPPLRRRVAMQPLSVHPTLSQSTPSSSNSTQAPLQVEKIPEISEESPQKPEFSLPLLDVSLPLDISISELTSTWANEKATTFKTHTSDLRPSPTACKESDSTLASSGPMSKNDDPLLARNVLYIAASR